LAVFVQKFIESAAGRILCNDGHLSKFNGVCHVGRQTAESWK
jgi:hypothetical protein